jgi:spore coat protein U-like protein
MSRNAKRIIGIGIATAFAILTVALSQDALATTATTTFQVQITITNSCVIGSANTLDFGSHGPLVSNVDASTTLSVQCTNSLPFNIGLDAGTGVGATFANRKMTSGGGTVTYALYQDNGRSTLWGDVVGTNTVSGTGTGSSATYTVYGRVLPQSTPAAGTYTDTITLIVTF